MNPMKRLISTILLALIVLLFCVLALATDETFATAHTTGKADTKQVLEHFWHDAAIPAVFSPQESSHLRDVRIVLWGIVWTFALLLLTFLFLPRDPAIIRNAGIMLLILLCISALIPFDSLFTSLHHILFPQGNWTFPTTSTLIQYYPITFWITYAQTLALLVLKLSISFIVIGLFLDISHPTRRKL